ncbi:hypothetical protein KJ611_00220 [Patescibacteria group bacterium]|nr:hypothetical protein [Patescibacteria group bacterium]MBU1705666.1 hypothetical protein [Patescibacteria group bacterium]
MAEVKEALKKVPEMPAAEAPREVEVRQEKREKVGREEGGGEKIQDSEVTQAEQAVQMAAAAPPPLVKDPIVAQIESVMAEDLTDLFLGLSPEQQAVFQQKGEETASLIKEMIMQAKVNMKKVFELLRDWLRLLPGVNKFFLEQEAKIKADKILGLAKEEQRRASEQIA